MKLLLELPQHLRHIALTFYKITHLMYMNMSMNNILF